MSKCQKEISRPRPGKFGFSNMAAGAATAKTRAHRSARTLRYPRLHTGPQCVSRAGLLQKKGGASSEIGVQCSGGTDDHDIGMLEAKFSENSGLLPIWRRPEAPEPRPRIQVREPGLLLPHHPTP